MKTKFLAFILLISTISLANFNSNCSCLNHKVEYELYLIKKKNDSLNKRIVEIENHKSIDVIEKVDNFYNNAWNKLIIILSAAGSITLFLIPYLTAKNQQEKLKLKAKEFEEMVNTKVTDMESKISQFHGIQFDLLKTEIGSTQSDLRKNLNDEINYVNTFIFILRGMLAEKDNDYNEFFKFYVIAISRLFGLDKTGDIDSMIKAIIERINHCVKEGIKINKDTKSRLDKLVKNLEENYPEELSNKINIFKEKIESLTVL